MKTTASSLRFQTMVKEQTKKTNSFVGGRKGVFFFFFLLTGQDHLCLEVQ